MAMTMTSKGPYMMTGVTSFVPSAASAAKVRLSPPLLLQQGCVIHTHVYIGHYRAMHKAL